MKKHKPIPGSVPFVDTFVNLNNWMVSDWPDSHGGIYAPDHVDVAAGMLRLKLSQTRNPDGTVSSVGGEVHTRQSFGYGVYTWLARMGSVAATPTALGAAVSGGVSGLFNYIDGHLTEIDFEAEGQYPRLIDLTVWNPTREQILVDFPESAQLFHEYKLVWTAGRAQFSLDGAVMWVKTNNVPSTPAPVFMDHWGTNSTGFGGLATPGVDRYLYVRLFSFQPI